MTQFAAEFHELSDVVKIGIGVLICQVVFLSICAALIVYYMRKL